MKDETRTLLYSLILLLCLNLAWLETATAGPADDWEAKKQDLDAAYEEAREERLGIERAQYVDECAVTKQKESRAACERFYRDYGSRSGSRAPLYYDLPECVRAFKHRQSQRNSDSRK